MSDCKICKNTFLPKLQFSCGDSICSNCIHKVLVYNLNNLLEMDGIKKEINLKCLICDTGFYKTKKIEIYEFIQIIPKEEEKVSSTCEVHKLDFIIDCLKCDQKLCMNCFSTHPKNHPLSQDKNAKKRICATCKNEVLEFQCITCMLPCCLICQKTVHKNHTIMPINEYIDKKLGEINSIKLPKNELNEFRENLHVKERKAIETLKKISLETVQKINGLITKMKDLIEIIQTTCEEKKGEIKISNFIIENVFTKIYSDISKVPRDEYWNMHLLSKLPKNFPDFKMKSNVIGNHEDSFTLILKELDKIKNENIKFEKLEIEWEFNYKYNLVKTSNKTNRNILSIDELEKGLILTATEEKVIIFDMNKNFEKITEFGQQDQTYIYDYYGRRQSNGYFTCSLKLPDSKIVIGDIIGNIFVYDSKNNYNLIKNSRILNNKISCLEFISKQDCVACGSSDGNIKIVEHRNLTCKNTISANSPIRCLLYIPNRDILLSGSDDNIIRVWDVSNCYKLIRSLNENIYPINSLCLLKNGLFASGSGSEIKIWNEEFICQKSFKAHDSPITCLKLLENGDLVSCSSDKIFKVWSKYYTYCKSTVDVGTNINSILILPYYKILTVAGNCEIKEWSFNFKE